MGSFFLCWLEFLSLPLLENDFLFEEVENIWSVLGVTKTDLGEL